MNARLALACVTIFACTAAAPMPTVPTSSMIDLGSAKLIAQTDATAQLAGVQISLPAGLDRESVMQNGLAALCAETVLATPSAGVALRDAVAARGGSIAYTLGQQSVRIYLESTPEALPAIVGLVTRALVAPDASPATLSVARKRLAARIADDERNPVSVGMAMLRASYYLGGAGYALYGTTGSIANLGPADVRTFAAAHYRRGGTSLTLVGSVSDAITGAAKALVAALPDSAADPVHTTIHAFAATSKRIVTHRDLGVPYVVLGFAAPSLGEKDFGAMLIMRSLLADIFDRQSATTLPVYSRAVGVIYNYDQTPSSLSVYVNGGQLDPTAGLGSIDAVLKGIGEKALTPILLKRYKASAHGEWQSEAITLQDRAWSIGNFLEAGASPDYAQTALASIDTTTAADVQRVAKKYLQRFSVALILPRDPIPTN